MKEIAAFIAGGITGILILVISEPRKTQTIDAKVRILENNTCTIIKITQAEIKLLKDTVWVNLATHRIDDISDNTMKAVFQP